MSIKQLTESLRAIETDSTVQTLTEGEQLNEGAVQKAAAMLTLILASAGVQAADFSDVLAKSKELTGALATAAANGIRDGSPVALEALKKGGAAVMKTAGEIGEVATDAAVKYSRQLAGVNEIQGLGRDGLRLFGAGDGKFAEIASNLAQASKNGAAVAVDAMQKSAKQVGDYTVKMTEDQIKKQYGKSLTIDEFRKISDQATTLTFKDFEAGTGVFSRLVVDKKDGVADYGKNGLKAIGLIASAQEAKIKEIISKL